MQFSFLKPNVDKLLAKRDVDGLIKALGYEKDRNIRLAAVAALGEIRDPRAVEPLIDILRYKYDPKLRLAVATALGEIGDARAVKSLIVAYKSLLVFSPNKDDLEAKSEKAILNAGLSLKKLSKLEIGQVHCGDDNSPHNPGSHRRCAVVDVRIA